MLLVRLHICIFHRILLDVDNTYVIRSCKHHKIIRTSTTCLSTRSPSGEMVTGGSADRVVRLWDESSGQVRKEEE